MPDEPFRNCLLALRFDNRSISNLSYTLDFNLLAQFICSCSNLSTLALVNNIASHQLLLQIQPQHLKQLQSLYIDNHCLRVRNRPSGDEFNLGDDSLELLKLFSANLTLLRLMMHKKPAFSVETTAAFLSGFTKLTVIELSGFVVDKSILELLSANCKHLTEFTFWRNEIVNLTNNNMSSDILQFIERTPLLTVFCIHNYMFDWEIEASTFFQTVFRYCTSRVGEFRLL